MQERNRILVLADAHSIHTEKWIEGLALDTLSDFYVINLNSNPTRPSIKSHARVIKVFELGLKKVKNRGGNFGYLLKVPKILFISRTIKPHVISTVFLTSYGLIGSLIKGRRQKLFHYLIGTDLMVTANKNFAYRLAAKFSLARANLIMSASQAIAAKVKSIHPPAESYSFALQYGVPQKLLTTDTKHSKGYDFVSNRAWVPNSNIELILEIFSKLPEKYNLQLIGDGGALVDSIKGLVKQTKGVTHSGIVDHATVVKLVSDSRFFLSWTTSDGAPLSLMEAMAIGCVPIVSDTAPNREWIQHQINGFLIPLGSKKDALDIVTYALAQPASALDKMIEINRSIIKDRGCFESNMGFVCQRIRDILNPNQASTLLTADAAEDQ